MSEKGRSIKSVSAVYFSKAGKMSKIAFWILCFAAFIEVFCMVFGEADKTCKSLHGVEALLLTAYSILTLGSSLLNFKGRKLKINDVVDNAFGTDIGEKHSENYFDNEEVKEGTVKLLYNTTESCFFSYRELKYIEWRAYAKTLLPLAVFVIGLILNRAELIMAIFRITVIIVLVVQSVRCFFTILELESLQKRMISTLKHKIGKVSQFNAESINYALEYETVMVWYGEKIPDEVYYRLNESLTEEWNNLKKTFVVK